MHPDHRAGRCARQFHLCPDAVENPFPAQQPSACFWIPGRNKPDTESIQPQKDMIKKDTQVAAFSCLFNIAARSLHQSHAVVSTRSPTLVKPQFCSRFVPNLIRLRRIVDSAFIKSGEIMRPIQMVDLKQQYTKIKSEVDSAISAVVESAVFINGKPVADFAAGMAAYNGSRHVIPCANGTDALQIAMMALDLQPGDEVITPSFTYIATTEVVALLRLTPVFVDVDPKTFCMDPAALEAAITPRTRAIVPVHLYGHAAPMAAIMDIAKRHGLSVIEDNAQAIGCVYTHPDGLRVKTGAIGTIGSTSFFPSKNLGCYGDGGAIFTDDDTFATRLKMIANHGQSRRYYHEIVGCNSRLDSIQAAVLNVKLKR